MKNKNVLFFFILAFGAFIVSYFKVSSEHQKAIAAFSRIWNPPGVENSQSGDADTRQTLENDLAKAQEALEALQMKYEGSGALNAHSDGTQPVLDKKQRRLAELNYSHGVLSDIQKIYHKNGQVQYLVDYENGKLSDRVQKGFDENGDLLWEGQRLSTGVEGKVVDAKSGIMEEVERLYPVRYVCKRSVRYGSQLWIQYFSDLSSIVPFSEYTLPDQYRVCCSNRDAGTLKVDRYVSAP